MPKRTLTCLKKTLPGCYSYNTAVAGCGNSRNCKDTRGLRTLSSTKLYSNPQLKERERTSSACAIALFDCTPKRFLHRRLGLVNSTGPVQLAYLLASHQTPLNSQLAEIDTEMVHFGAHMATSMVPGWEPNYVDFDKLRTLASDSKTDLKVFDDLWKEELDKCSEFYDKLSQDAIAALFSFRKNNELARRICAQLPGLCKTVNRGYGESFSYGESTLERYDSFFSDQCESDAIELNSSVLPLFEQRRVFGLLNLEALRKLIKKLEKYVDEEHACKLYIQLSLSFLANSLNTDFSTKLRCMIGECMSRRLSDVSDFEQKTKHDTDGSDLHLPPLPPLSSISSIDDTPPRRSRSKGSNSSSSGPSPFEQLCVMVRGLDKDIREKLVSHRGFHSKRDELHRPLENTLSAYEQSWASGLLFCECDITLTLDGRLVLCHDNDLKRLARDPEHSSAFKPVNKLTFDELYALPLKNGTSAPLLEEVLRTATRAGPNSGLVIEIKSGADGAEVAAALCKLLVDNPNLLSKVAVVMSFDLYIIHNFNNFFKSSFEDGSLPAKVPKILFLTRDSGTAADSEVEMPIDWTNDPASIKSVVEGYVVQGNSRLDGVYLQFHPSMVIENHATARVLRELTALYTVGVWGARDDPDDLDTVTGLADVGISFINTDLPEDFIQEEVPQIVM